MLNRHRKLKLPFLAVVSIGLGMLLPSFYKAANQAVGKYKAVPTSKIRPPLPPSRPEAHPCSCGEGTRELKTYVPPEEFEEVMQQRAKEFKHYKQSFTLDPRSKECPTQSRAARFPIELIGQEAGLLYWLSLDPRRNLLLTRTASVLSKLLYAVPNCPLQYPIQGFIVQPLQPTLIPGLGLYAETRKSYKVVLNVNRGVLNIKYITTEATIQGNGSSSLTVESREPDVVNELLFNVWYTSTFYHINSGDLATFRFENNEIVFPIAIKRPQMPILHYMGTDINSQVTIVTKTFLRYNQLEELIYTIRSFYSFIKIIIADDSTEPRRIRGRNIEQYMMPPLQGWFAGRNLGVSQVTTKYFLWVDDDYLFTEDTKIEKFLEVLEANPELDMVGGSVRDVRFYFSLLYEEGEEEEGGCLYRKNEGHFDTLPGYPECLLVDGVVNFFLARTDSVRKVGFDPQLQRVAHSEVFMDGMGSLMIASCSGVSIGHQPHPKVRSQEYMKYRNPGIKNKDYRNQLHFSKNHLKCIRWR